MKPKRGIWLVKARVVVPALVLLLGAEPQRADPRHGPAHPQVPEISERINAFTVDYMKRLAGPQAGNTIVSPQSIFHGLAMIYVASGGDTRQELAKAVGFPDDDAQLMTDLAALRQQLASAANHRRIDVRVANSAWLDGAHATFRKEYVQKLAGAFAASLHSVRFQDREATSRKINAWIFENTNGRIAGGVGPDDFESRSGPGVIDEAALVTVNAVYYKADWASRFEKSATRERTFHPRSGTTENAMLMHQRSLLPYSENDDLKFLELPYIAGHYSMYVLLPKDILSATELVSLVTSQTIDQMQSRAFPHEVDVLLPRFEIGSHCSVKDVLSDMGVTSAFDSQRADFDGMIIKKIEAFRIYLSQIYHDAWIEVNEEGTEAAAATSSVHFSLGCSAPAPAPRAEFHADHPFLFFIVHNGSRSILFGGWIVSPMQIAQHVRATAK